MYVSGEARRLGLHFVNADDFRSFEGKPSCHDEAYVAAAQNYATLGRHKSHQIDEILRRSRRVNARRSGALHEYLFCRSFPATRGKHYGFGSNGRGALVVDVFYFESFVKLGYFGNEGLFQNVGRGFFKHIYKTLRILRPRQLFAEGYKAESVVDTLFQNAAETFFALDQKGFPAVVGSRNCRRKPRRAAAYNNYVVRHTIFPPWSFREASDCGRCLS